MYIGYFRNYCECCGDNEEEIQEEEETRSSPLDDNVKGDVDGGWAAAKRWGMASPALLCCGRIGKKSQSLMGRGMRCCRVLVAIVVVVMWF